MEVWSVERMKLKGMKKRERSEVIRGVTETTKRSKMKDTSKALMSSQVHVVVPMQGKQKTKGFSSK
ncbi:hypothetical protein IC582_019786 [Cucumis melo]